ncbi:MAG: OpgC domain-containing protein [Methylobacteriaceae bacterium]|nr:OpgC domain-containing protein [Methylobacteriaceae bacterium]MBV9247279.1 OpgC domain-containing protein [Methylobacteriaceae bacterium]
MASQRRVDTIDFWRGVVLVVILVDHIPGNLLESLTPRNYGFSDSAEAFVFLSGVSVGLVYYRKVLQADMIGVVRRCLGRAFRIYGVHIALTCCAIAVFAAAYWLSAVPNLIEADGRHFVFHKPLRGTLGVLMLSEQLGYFNILPMYIVLMLLSPLMLAMARRSLALLLAASAAIYAAARFFGLALPNWPESGTWFLNPFAWQLMFSIGIVAGILWRDRPVPRSTFLLVLSGIFLVLAGISVTDGLWIAPGLRDAVFQRLDILKQNLGLARMLHFLMVAYLISQMPALTAVARTGLGRELQRLGRHSLPVFAFGSLFSCLGQAGMRLVDLHFSDGIHMLGMLYTLFGVAGLFLLARYLEWTKRGVVRQVRPVGNSSPGASPVSLHSSFSLQ